MANASDTERRTNTRIMSYNSGMRKRNGTTETGTETLIGTAVMIGGFLTALLLSRVRIHGLHSPLSLGLLLGSQLAGFEPAAIVGGIVLGAFAEAKPYWQGVSAALLYWGITRIIILIRKKCSPAVRFLIFTLCMAATLPISMIYGTEELQYGLISLLVSVLSSFCFRRLCLTVKTVGRARMITDVEQIAIALSIGALILSVSDAVFLGWSFSVSLLLLLTMIAVSVRGIVGAASGIFWSVMLTLYTGSDHVLIGTVSLGALTGAVLREKGKPLVIGAMILSGLLFRSFSPGEAYGMSIPNLLCGVLFFALLPRGWLTALKQCFDPRLHMEKIAADAAKQSEHRASRELERMGKLLGGFSGIFHTEPPEDDTVDRWTVQGALAICRGCEVRRLCWRDPVLMREAVRTLAEEAGKGRRVEPIDPIDENCRHFGDFCASVLLSYQQAQNRNAIVKQVQLQADAAERQLSGAGAALCTYARDMRSRTRNTKLTERRIRDRITEAGYDLDSLDVYETNGAEMISIGVRRPRRRKTRLSEVQTEIEKACGYRLRRIQSAQNEDRVSFTFERDTELHAAVQISRVSASGSVSGDAAGECRMHGGRVCFALSDGMGRGRKARNESEAAIRLLFRLYHSGVQKELVYENVNRMLLAQNESEIYATLDAVSIDLNTGEAEMLKYGAPPSFLLREGQVRTICGEALPCGILAEAQPSVIRIRLQRNDRIVLCSDGVQDVLTEGMENTIRAAEQAGGTTGDALLELAQTRGGSDDMTVMVIRVA